VLVLAMVEHLVPAHAEGAELLEKVVVGDLFLASEKPAPTDGERAAPTASGNHVLSTSRVSCRSS